MSRSRRPKHGGRRREQGHPERIAKRRERNSGDRRVRAMLTGMCEEAAGLSGAYEAELFASELLAYPWEERGLGDSGEFEAELGGQLTGEIAAAGGPGAVVLLAAISHLAGPALANRATDQRRRLGEVPGIPVWAEAIGTARPERTAVAFDPAFDDGRTYFIESVNADGEREVVGVYIDHNLGCSAKDILTAPSIKEVRRVFDDHAMPEAPIQFEEVDPTLAAARIRAAMELTDLTVDPVVEEGYAGFRALALNRVAGLPDAEPDDGIPEVGEEEQDALLAEFLASPEGKGIEAGSDAEGIVSSAIGFASAFVDGRPLRWSPVTVEVYLVGWLPNKVIASDEYFSAAPEALQAWVRFAGRKRELSPELIEQVVAAVDECSDGLAERVADPSGDGPGKDLFRALEDAGVDATDEQAVQTFIAGWNARSELDLD